MKKFLLIILVVVGLGSCNLPTIDKKDELPIEVVQLREVNQFDTILVIQTDKEVHQFDTKRTYTGSYNTKSDELGAGVILGIILCLVIFGLFCLIDSI